MDLINEMFTLNANLKEAVKRLALRGQERAIAENEYYKAKAKRALELKAENMPTTLITSIIKGDEYVVDKLLARDIAQAHYEVAMEYINATKVSIRIIENQINREWKG